MQTTVRNLPVPMGEITRIAPSDPVWDDRHGRHQSPPSRTDRLHPEREAASAAQSENRALLRPDAPLRARTPPLHPDQAGLDGWSAGRTGMRRALLSSATFQAQHLGQVPRYGNEALLRAAAADAYQRASGLSVQYLGAFSPVDIEV